MSTVRFVCLLLHVYLKIGKYLLFYCLRQEFDIFRNLPYVRVCVFISVSGTSFAARLILLLQNLTHMHTYEHTGACLQQLCLLLLLFWCAWLPAFSSVRSLLTSRLVFRLPTILCAHVCVSVCLNVLESRSLRRFSRAWPNAFLGLCFYAIFPSTLLLLLLLSFFLPFAIRNVYKFLSFGRSITLERSHTYVCLYLSAYVYVCVNCSCIIAVHQTVILCNCHSFEQRKIV